MKKTAEKQEGKNTEAAGAKTRSVLATTLSSSCLAVSAVAVPATVPQNLVGFTDYPVSNVLEKLVMDKTTGRRLTMGGSQHAAVEISPLLLSRKPSPVMPRVEKSREAQGARTKKNAEVFTPSWLCRKMVDYLDDEIISTQRRREAENDNHVEGMAGDMRTPPPAWRKYVDTRALEITCGEAPFIVSRYDATTGMLIPVKERIGLLDRKLRAVNENAADEEEWMKWAVRAYESVYGYEYQGDSLVIARANLLITFADNLEARWGRKATKKELTEIANRIVWNFWQMDGLSGTVEKQQRIDQPYFAGMDAYAPEKKPTQGELFGLEVSEEDLTAKNVKATRIPCVIFDWRKRCKVIYNDIGKREAKTMKFDYAIGNPPYQEETIGDNRTYAPPVYHKFMDGAYTVADKVELVTPARFLFNAGSTPKSWNQKMLMDSHLRVLEYFADSKKVFPSITDLTGGVVVSYYDNNNENGQAIELFTQYQELNAIFQKVESVKDFRSMASSVFSRTVYRLTPRLHRDFPDAASHLSEGHMFDMASNIFDSLPKIFLEKLPMNCSSDSYCIKLCFK